MGILITSSNSRKKKKKKGAIDAKVRGLAAYHRLVSGPGLSHPKLCLEVRGWVEVAAGVACAPPFYGVHANSDGAFVCGAYVVGRVCEAAFGLAPLTRSALKLPAHLKGKNYKHCQLPSLSSIMAPLAFAHSPSKH